MTSAPPAPLPRILTGDTPTSAGLHLGHYVGSLENRLALQHEFDCFFLIANVHAFTTMSERAGDIRSNTLAIVKDWIAVGLDPARSTFVLQSEVPAIAELTFLFAMLIPFNKVMKNPTLKTEIEQKGLGDSYPFGFPMYAVGQCADILAFRPALVPVGEDQRAHIELCRDVALKFNQMYCGVGNRVPEEQQVSAGGVFPLPQARVGRVGRLVGTDGAAKMSKSLGNAIFLSDSEKDVQKKISKIVTGRATPTSPLSDDSPLAQYIDVFLPTQRASEIKAAYAGGAEVMDGHIKAEVAGAINALLSPIRERRARLDGSSGDEVVLGVLREGAKRANDVAEATLADAKKAMRIDLLSRTLSFRD